MDKHQKKAHKLFDASNIKSAVDLAIESSLRSAGPTVILKAVSDSNTIAEELVSYAKLRCSLLDKTKEQLNEYIQTHQKQLLVLEGKQAELEGFLDRSKFVHIEAIRTKIAETREKFEYSLPTCVDQGIKEIEAKNPLDKSFFGRTIYFDDRQKVQPFIEQLGTIVDNQCTVQLQQLKESLSVIAQAANANLRKHVLQVIQPITDYINELGKDFDVKFQIPDAPMDELDLAELQTKSGTFSIIDWILKLLSSKGRTAKVELGELKDLASTMALSKFDTFSNEILEQLAIAQKKSLTFVIDQVKKKWKIFKAP